MWESSIFIFPLKKTSVFFFEVAHGLGFGHGVLLLIDGPCSCFFFFFLFALRSWEPESTPGPNLCKYTHIRIRTYTYKCIYIYIYIFMREGGSSNAEAQTMTSHRRWWDQSSWAGLGLGRKLIFLFYRSNIVGDSGVLISMRPGFGPTTFRPDSCLGQGLASSLEVAVGHSSEWPCRVNEHP